MPALVANGHLIGCQTRVHQHGPCWCKLKGYIVASMLAFVIACAEIIGGIVSGSISLLGDAWHVSSDMFVYGVAGYAFYLKTRQPGDSSELDREWGLRISWVLTVVASATVVFSCYRIFNPTEVHTQPMFWVAAAGLLGNLLMLWLLKSLHIDHDHGPDHHQHDETHWGAMLHTAIDAGLNIIVIIAAILMSTWPEEPLTGHADSIGSILICLILLSLARGMRKRIRKN
jgi:cation diffusion facilitator family transporter